MGLIMVEEKNYQSYLEIIIEVVIGQIKKWWI